MTTLYFLIAIHCVEDFEKLLKDIYKLLNDEGYFILSQEHPIGTGTKLNKNVIKKMIQLLEINTIIFYPTII